MTDNDALQVLMKVSEHINNQIKNHGELQRNNKEVWRVLHGMDNTVWRYYVHGIKILNKHFPHCVPMDVFTHALKCEALITQYENYYDNVLTPHKTRENHKYNHNFKGVAWKMVLMGRETWNRAMRIDLPNSDTSKTRPADNILEFGS